MHNTRLFPVFVLAAAVALAGCDFQRKTSTTPGGGSPTVPTPASAPSLLGTWSTDTTQPAAGSQSCTTFQWVVLTQTATDVSGTFTATCLGNIDVAGIGTGHIDGTSLPVTLTGNAKMPLVATCPFSFSGTGTIDGDVITIPYTGTTCLGPMSGTQKLRRGQIQPSK